jgi:hypothetical protein
VGIQGTSQNTAGWSAGARRGLAAAVGPLACLALILGFFFIARSLGWHADSDAFGPFPRPVPNSREAATVEIQGSPQSPAALAPSPAAPSPFSPAADGAGAGEEGAPILVSVSSRDSGAGSPTTIGSGPVSPHTPFAKPTTSSPPPPPPGPSKAAKPAKSAKKHGKPDKPAKAKPVNAGKPAKAKPSKPSKPPKADKPAKSNNGNKGKKAAKPEKAKGGGKGKKH